MIVDQPRLLNSSPGRGYALVGFLSVALGLSLVARPFYSSLLFVVAVVVALCFVIPRPDTTLLVLLLLFQDPLQILAGGDTELALYVKRADEFLILAVALGCLALPVVRSAFLVRRIYLFVLGCYLGLILSSLLVGRPSSVAASIDLVLFSKPFLFLAIGVSLTPPERAVERHLPNVLLLLTAVLFVALVFFRMPVLHERFSTSGPRAGSESAWA